VQDGFEGDNAAKLVVEEGAEYRLLIRVELAVAVLGNRRSILLSYGVTAELLPHLPGHFHSFGQGRHKISTSGNRNKAGARPFSGTKGP
jgi:hypothetical protein